MSTWMTNSAVEGPTMDANSAFDSVVVIADETNAMALVITPAVVTGETNNQPGDDFLCDW